MSFLSIFGLNDVKNIRRDPLLLYIILVPWLFAVLIRLLIPIVGNWFHLTYSQPVEQYYPLVLSFFIILEVPFLFGLIFGLMFLDEKDDHVLTVLRVTPVSLLNYIYYRFFIIIALSVVYVMLILPATGIMEMKYWLDALPVAVLGGCFAVNVLLLLINFANNKVEGLAILKGFGIFMIAPLAAYFINSSLEILFGVFPTYWPAKAFWLVSTGQSAFLYILGGLLVNTTIFLVLYRRFKRRIGLG